MTIDPNDATARLAGVTDGTPFLDLTNQHGTHRWYYTGNRQWYDPEYKGTRHAKTLFLLYPKEVKRIEEAMAR